MFVALLSCTAVAGELAAPSVGPRLGLLLEPGARGLPRAVIEDGRPAPLARIEVSWERIERIEGVFDWTGVVPTIDSLVAAGYRPVVALVGSNPLYLSEGTGPSPLVDGSMDAWTQFLRSAVSSLGDGVTVYEIGNAGGGPTDLDADVAALVLKQSALAVRAEAGDRPVWIAQHAIGIDDLDRQTGLWERDVAAYIDILPVQILASDDLDRIADDVRTFLSERLKYPPAPAVWAHVKGAEGWRAASIATSVLSAGASVAFLAPGGDDDTVRWTLNMHSLLVDGFAPATAGQARLEYTGGRDVAGAQVLGRFFNENDFGTMVVYRAPRSADPGAEPRLHVDSRSARNIRVLDPLTGRTRRARKDSVDSGVAIHLLSAIHPLAALYERSAVSPGFDMAPEEVQVESERGLTAEEIIARFQQLQREQDDRLERWTASGRIDFHFSLAQGGSGVDVSIDSNYFWERDGELEWEQTGYYINGNKVKWKNIPELPLIQPEKVVTLPLDLTLDKTYAYRLIGTERIRGRQTYVVEFRPAAEGSQSLYRGRLWIDTVTFARIQARVIQTQMESPVLSNDEIDRFAEQEGPDGYRYWMFSDIDGQQIWNVAGRAFVVRREVTFSSYEINPPRREFEQDREKAYASQNQMLRDTDEGFRYLARQDDGTRVVQDVTDTSQIFAAAGAFKDNSQDNVVPLAGVNYFNYDLFGKGVQFNVLFAGVLGFATLSKPDFFGGKMDLTIDLGLSALKADDKVFEGDLERIEQRVEDRNQRIAIRLGVPLGSFFKASLIGAATYRQYFDDDDSLNALALFNADPMPVGTELVFVLPEDHLEVSAGVELSFNRRGFALTGQFDRFDRSDWQAWGLRDAGGMFGDLVDGVFVPGTVEPSEDSFARWGVTAAKEWFLPKFQKVRGSVDVLGGSDLDRFSQYEFSFFGKDRLNGFSGSGVRFDEAVIARMGYSFNLFEVIRLDAVIESARVEQDRSSIGDQSFTGLGISGNIVGPWKTVINLNYGYALRSDISELEGEQEFLLLVLKLF